VRAVGAARQIGQIAGDAALVKAGMAGFGGRWGRWGRWGYVLENGTCGVSMR
jgi:hypothetical protein